MKMQIIIIIFLTIVITTTIIIMIVKIIISRDKDYASYHGTYMNLEISYSTPTPPLKKKFLALLEKPNM